MAVKKTPRTAARASVKAGTRTSRKTSPARAKAITATAHKIAKIYYNALKYGKKYVDEGASKYEARFRQWAEGNLRRRAKQLGFDITPLQ